MLNGFKLTGNIQLKKLKKNCQRNSLEYKPKHTWLKSVYLKKKNNKSCRYLNIFDWKKLKYCKEIKVIKSLKLNLRFMLPSVSSLFL